MNIWVYFPTFAKSGKTACVWGRVKPLKNRVEPYTFRHLYTEPYTAKTLIISIFSTIWCIECIECMVIFRKVSMEYILHFPSSEVVGGKVIFYKGF